MEITGEVTNSGEEAMDYSIHIEIFDEQGDLMTNFTYTSWKVLGGVRQQSSRTSFSIGLLIQIAMIEARPTAPPLRRPWLTPRLYLSLKREQILVNV